MDKLSKGNKVLVIWNSSNSEDLQEFVNKLKETVGQENISLENSERLSLSGHSDSKFDAVLSNVIAPYNINHNDSCLATILKVVKPGGTFILKDNSDDIKLTLKLTGFIDVNQNGEHIVCNKPNFEVGSSMKLGKKVWKLDNEIESAWSNNQEDDEVIDDNKLLDEDDLKKPDPGSLKVCSTTGKRKACANCSCGLAEELAGETNAKQEQPKSSCGNCYLGDAFRCASCPYLGMPAFKPGEKVLLADLKPDL